jgi:hypothetical protein
MAQQRESFYQQDLKKPRGQLDLIWKETRQLMSTNNGGSIMDEHLATIPERVGAVKKWADELARSVEYPNDAVLHFVASIKTS